MKSIVLTKGFLAWVDEKDFESLNKFKWYAHRSMESRRGTYYACRKRRKEELKEGWKRNIHVSMHREIMNPPKNMDIDHINGNGLDNTRANLRIVTKTQNMQNARKRITNKTGFRGISFDTQTGKLRAWIQVDKKFIHLGRFASIEEAIKARKIAEKQYFGEYTNSV